MKDRRRHLIVLASTFPRWANDSVPDFVLQFTRHVLPAVRSATVIVPHFAGAKRKEVLDDDILVKRFRYAYPYRYENLTYGQVAKKTIMYKVRGICYVIAELRATFWICLRRRPAVISAHWMIPQGFVAIVVGRIFGARVVISIHGQDVAFKLGGTMGKLVLAVKRWVLQHADEVVANSSATQALCKVLYQGKGYPVIPMGVDVARFKSMKRKPTGVYKMIFVGRLADVKGVIYLCEAVRLLYKKHQDIHLKIIGDGPERQELERFVRDNKLSKVITFAGWVQPGDLPKQYQSADVFVGPSVEGADGRQEAFGLVFAEAAAAGLPVVTTGIGGIRDIVQDKKTGIIVPQRDARALCNTLEYLYAHRTEGVLMGERGRKLVEASFSWDAIAEKYIAILTA